MKYKKGDLVWFNLNGIAINDEIIRGFRTGKILTYGLLHTSGTRSQDELFKTKEDLIYHYHGD